MKRDNVDVNASDRDSGRTALHHACINSLADVALEILEGDDVNVNVNAEDKNGVTALLLACYNC